MASVWELVMAIISVVMATYILYMRWLRSRYPPGPWPLPLIGNMHLLSKNQHFDFTSLAKKYGPVYTMWLGSQPMVIVCNVKVAKEVLLQKGTEFAGRAMDTGGFKVLFRQKENIFNQSYNEKVLVMRKLAVNVLKSKLKDGLSFQKIAEEEILQLLQSIKNMSGQMEDPYNFINMPVSNTVTRSLVSVRFEDKSDARFIQWTNTKLNRATVFQQAALVTCFPFLWYFMPSIRRQLLASKKIRITFLDSAFQQHEDTYQEGVVRDCADEVIRFYRHQDGAIPASQRLTQQEAFGVLRDIMGGGTETTIASLCWAFLILLRRPDVEEKIHGELDRYLASRNSNTRPGGAEKDDGAPLKLAIDLSDRPHLPYLNAFIHETMRRCPVAPLLLPHKTLLDTTVGGFSIPANTAVICNIFACHLQESVWDRPNEIIPERFLNEEGQFDNVRSKELLSFGGGPRSCLGENLAKLELFLYLANILHVFKLSCPSIDELPTLNDVRVALECFPESYKMGFKERTK